MLRCSAIPPGQILLIHHDFRLAATISTPETCGKAPTR